MGCIWVSIIYCGQIALNNPYKLHFALFGIVLVLMLIKSCHNSLQSIPVIKSDSFEIIFLCKT